VVILDLDLSEAPGLAAFDRIHQSDAHLPIILISGQGNGRTAIAAMKRGAFDYLVKPLNVDQFHAALRSAVRVSRLAWVPGPDEDEPIPDADDGIVGNSPALQEIYKAIGRVAAHDLPVLILGESGTGKELVARAIYQNSNRAERPFLAINCAAIPESLLESELFGHEKGAFTGADRQRPGKFEQCHGGTLLLDEIGDMTPLTQAKILRVLQEQQIERVGGNQTITANVRVLAATHRPLEQLVAAGQFRRDLFYRLSVFAICLPPLRELLDDLPLLVEHFLRRFSRELGKAVHRASPETLALLRRYSWPGNVRELQSMLKQALLRATGPILLPEFLPAALSTDEARTRAARVTAYPGLDLFIQERLQAGSANLHAEVQQLADERLLSWVLRHTRGNQLRAARLLGIGRGKLRAKLRKLGLPTDRAAWLENDHSHQPKVSSADRVSVSA
jgi:two-component system nitrogen regulation response regulator GlnG